MPLKLPTPHYSLPSPLSLSSFSLSCMASTKPPPTLSSSDSCSSVSPPPSPPRHPTFRRRTLKRMNSSISRRNGFFAGMFLRRGARWMAVMAAVYVAGLVMCVGPMTVFFVGPAESPVGSVYRSHQVFAKLWGDIHADNSTSIQLSTVWRYRRKLKEQKSCQETSPTRNSGSSNLGYYLVVEANGGLNQQRSSICNAVAVAGLLNATLVMPHFEFNSVWRDSSQFADIYDEEHFISTLEDHVKVVRELPEELMDVFNFNINNIPILRVQAWATSKYYSEKVYPILTEQRVIRIAPFANRLAMNVPPNIQFLRCLSNYKALRFSRSISAFAKKLVNRMVEKSSNTGGSYISVHLRFEEDMVAFSCCVYDGGEAEKVEMDSIRKKGWGDKFKRKAHLIKPALNRVDGRCPMTPLEVGMMLRGMGFSNDTPIYLASGKIYQAEKHLAPLFKMLPLLQTKESLAKPDELAMFEGYSSRLAALDYLVCLYSEVFVTTQGGNFPHFLMGHRKFMYNGHAKTIKPDKSRLALLLQDTSISWKAFKDQMEAMLAENDRKGIMVPRDKKSNRKSSVFKNPMPECKCLWETKNMTLEPTNTLHMPDH